MRPKYYSGDVRLDSGALQDTDRNYSTATHFLKVSDSWNTIISLYNYWSWNYGLETARLNVTFCNSDGETQLVRDLDIASHGYVVIDARQWLAEVGIREVEGEAFFRISGDGLFPENPIQLIADYTFGEYCVSSVHGQGGLVDYAYSQRMHIISVCEHDGWHTSFDLKNHYFGKEPLGTKSAVAELFNEEGERLETYVSLPGSLSSQRYYVSEVFPESELFLGGKRGHLRVTAPYKMHRLFYMHENEGIGAVSVNHGTVEHNYNYPEWEGIPGKEYRTMGCSPITLALVLLGDGVSSGITLINTMGPPEQDHELRVDIFSASGSDQPVLRHDIGLKRGACVTLDFADLLSETTFEGHATVSVPWQSDDHAYPRQVDCIPYIRKNSYEASTHIGSGAHNIAVENAYFRKAGTRIFARLHCGPSLRSEAVIIYPTCGHPSPATSSTEVALIRGDGENLVREINVPRNGMLRLEVDDILGEESSFLGEDTSCTLRLADRKVRLWAFHVTHPNGGDGIAMDHFFGG